MASSGVFPFENPILNELVEALVDIKSKTLVDGGNVTTSGPVPLPLPAVAFPRRKRSRQITMKGVLEAYEKENEEDDPMWVPTSKVKKRKSTTIRVSDNGSSKKMNPIKYSIEPPKLMSISQLEATNCCFSQLEVGQTSPLHNKLPSNQSKESINF
ncbi:uncharacterized protein A4U43_C10F7660 [Asparagus officinalis]|uniref:Uncharacterized protein n=1 Tax=Asparagus officinalis TaxID=4686 RepID=A0A5P1E1B4_ASPOF|nr:uncharacterized protein A4U43_C10F7660 [Asparagus officinalis]